jgi:hypothetical protein
MKSILTDEEQMKKMQEGRKPGPGKRQMI